MGKLAQDLKERFLHIIEAAKCCRTATGNEDGEEPKMETVEHVEVEERAIRVRDVKGPERPSVPKGPPAQTNRRVDQNCGLVF